MLFWNFFNIKQNNTISRQRRTQLTLNPLLCKRINVAHCSINKEYFKIQKIRSGRHSKYKRYGAGVITGFDNVARTGI